MLAGKFSVPFAVATTLINGTSGVESFTVRQVSDARILGLAARVSVREDPEMTARLPDRRPARVTVRLVDGTELVSATETNRGDWADPYSVEEIRAKYLSLTTRLWTEASARTVWETVMALGEGADMSDLATVMRGAAR